MAVRALAEVNLAAIERNVGLIAGRVGPGARVCAVVKADAYGHGAAPVARAALRAGATMLAVATAREATELRAAGIDEAPILVMGAVSGEELPLAVGARAELVAWDERFVSALARQASATSGGVRVHVKLDTGMGRLGTREPAQALAVARAVRAAPGLTLAGAMTHFATSDEPDLGFAEAQLARFLAFLRALRAATGEPLVAHAANSAGALRIPGARLDMVRCGIAVYGSDPANVDPIALGLEPALTLRSYVAAVKPVAPGQSAGYGRRFIAERETWLATLPIGYADGVSRALTNNGEVLIGGRRHPIVGAVSMDNLTVELGAEPRVAVGEPAILIGAQGDDRLTAEEVARRIGTISYEVLCAISRRVPRQHHRDGEAE